MTPRLLTPQPINRPFDSMDSTGSLKICSFEEQANFSAIRHVGQIRGAAPCRRKEEPSTNTVWDIRAPNFAVKCYAPPIKKPLRAIAHPIEDGDAEAERREKAPEFKSIHRIHFSDMVDTEDKDKDFLVRFRIPTPNKARRIAIRNSKHPKGPYTDPKPHDHRGLPPIKSLGLPELKTSLQPDPLNIRFKKERLDILDLRQVLPERHQMVNWYTRKTPDPQWIRSLTLHNEPYRKRYAAFTRHRRLDRTVYSALMDRIEEDFDNKLKSHRPKKQKY